MDVSELDRRIGLHVESLRQAAALTRERLAEQTGRSVDALSTLSTDGFERISA